MFCNANLLLTVSELLFASGSANDCHNPRLPSVFTAKDCALRTEREAYVGPWLPEPLMHDTPPPPDRHLELASDLSVAFLALLERLGPEERAAFLLHEVFEFEYREIAAILEKSEDACRQIVHRGRTRIKNARKRFDVTEEAKAALLRKFTEAVNARDEHTLRALFAPDATWTADGGGRAAAGSGPIVGAERIARLVRGLLERLQGDVLTMELVDVNGETGLCLRVNDRITAVMSIVTDGDHIYEVYAVVNPDKLWTLSQRPLSSVSAMRNGGSDDTTS